MVRAYLQLNFELTYRSLGFLKIASQKANFHRLWGRESISKWHWLALSTRIIYCMKGFRWTLNTLVLGLSLSVYITSLQYVVTNHWLSIFVKMIIKPSCRPSCSLALSIIKAENVSYMSKNSSKKWEELQLIGRDTMSTTSMPTPVARTKQPRQRWCASGAKKSVQTQGKEIVEVVWSRPVRIAFLAHLVLRGFLEVTFIIMGYFLQGCHAYQFRLAWFNSQFQRNYFSKHE